MYDSIDYGQMIADRIRTAAYGEALRATVRPESVVLDVGTGSGILALLACRHGARRVYAVDPDPVIQLARKLADVNGCAERIRFLQVPSRELELPEPADVIVSDIHGVLPLFRDSLASIVDVRRRLLAKGGVLIPRRDTLWVAAVESPQPYAHTTQAWEDGAFGFDIRAARELATNTWTKARFTSDQLVSEPRCWATLSYQELEDVNVKGNVRLNVVREAPAHGLAVWFDCDLVDGVSFSNAPGQPALIFGHLFFPWSRPVQLALGDEIEVAFWASLAGRDYVWRWDTVVHARGRPGDVKARFTQSTFFSRPLSGDQLRRRSGQYVPHLKEAGEVARFVLERIDSELTNAEIARDLRAKFPKRFPQYEDALSEVGMLVERYGA